MVTPTWHQSIRISNLPLVPGVPYKMAIPKCILYKIAIVFCCALPIVLALFAKMLFKIAQKQILRNNTILDIYKRLTKIMAFCVFLNKHFITCKNRSPDQFLRKTLQQQFFRACVF
jgi:hypothetical protein